MNHNPKSQDRIAIEQILQAATAPMTREQIATQASLPPATVQRVLSNMRNSGAIRYVMPMAGKTERRFAWGSDAPVVPGDVDLGWRTRDIYRGAELRSTPARAGAMRAYTLPSIEYGTAVERRRPVSFGSTQLDSRLR